MTGPLQARETSMYESFYGLVQPPFTLSPDPRFLYLSGSHDVAIRHLLQSLRRKEAFIVLSGDIGTGKTTLCRALVQQLDRTTVSSLVLNPFLSVDDLLRQVLVDFGIVSRDAVLGDRLNDTSTTALTATLSDFLRTLAPLHGSAVLIIDEAQHLSAVVLEQLRVIAGLAGPDSGPLQIVLVGQPHLLEILAADDMRQLDQRISLKAMLKPLERDDVEQYIAHRLTVAGESVSVLFEKGAVRRVHALSGGVPRVINLLCDRALMAGAARGVHEITPEIVEGAAEALSYRRQPAAPHGRRMRIPRAVAISAAALVLFGVAALVAPIHRLVDVDPPALPSPPTPRIAVLGPPAIPAEDLLAPGVSALDLPPGETPDDAVVDRRLSEP